MDKSSHKLRHSRTGSNFLFQSCGIPVPEQTNSLVSPVLAAQRVSAVRTNICVLLRIPSCMVCRLTSEPSLLFKTRDQSRRKDKMLCVRFGWL